MAKKLVKIIAVLAIVVLILVAGGIWWALNNLNWIVRSQIESHASHALMVPVTVGGVEVNLSEQWVEISEIEIANPDGYRTSHAMKFGLIRVEIDAASFRTMERRVKLIRISESDISYERTLRTSNLQELMDNVSRLIDEDAPPPDPEKEPRLLIDQMVIEDTTVRLTLPLASTVATSSGNATLKISDIVIEDYGDGEQQTPAEALQMFIAVILKTILENAGSILSAEALASLGNTLEGLPGGVADKASETADKVSGVATEVSDELRQALGGVGDTVGEAADSVGDAVDDVRRGFGRILPGGRRDEGSQDTPAPNEEAQQE